MLLLVAALMMTVVIVLYFLNNPMDYQRSFLVRRFVNWFPLGMTYAFLYMGRYNLTVSKTAFGSLMSKEDFGLIFAAGTVVYAFSFLVNGPLVDKIGGKKGILIAGVGASLANIAMGVVTWLMLTGRIHVNLVLTFSLLYAVNMYFQSYGAVSIIKVKAYWFHVRERGMFGAIFGTLISFGVYFAFDWGQAIADVTKAHAPDSFLHRVLASLFTFGTSDQDLTWTLFFVPAVLLLVWVVLDFWLIKDTPEEAGFGQFDAHDASSGEMHVDLSTKDLLKRVFLSPIMLMIAFVGLTSGVLRNGIMNWYSIYAREVPQPGAETLVHNWGLLLCFFGIIGGFAGGLISDKLYHSRRGPPAVLLSAFMVVMMGIMAACMGGSPLWVGLSALLTVAAVTGVHSLMSGTAAADFGGRKATATCAGIVDGFVYLGSGIQSISLGYITTNVGWFWWPVFLAPFALLGALIASRFWHDLPAATRKYIAEKEKQSTGA
jgi:OPA family glycerol-3-phosphate transporter-like MFS transporter